MIISYNGLESFRIQYSGTTLAVNPVSKESKEKQSKFGSDIALSTLNHPDMNGFQNVTHGDKEPFEITGPGAYELRDIFIEGYPSVSQYGGLSAQAGKEGINTIYTILLEDMKLCFLGALSESKLTDKTQEALGDIDVLFVPVGNEEVLSAQDASKLAASLEPRIIIPMHYDDVSLKTFLKESGAENVKPEAKLTLKKKDLIGKEADIIVLKES